MVVALHRLPQGNLKGITQCLALDLKLDFDPTDTNYTETFDTEIYGIECRTHGHAIEILEHKAKNLIYQLLNNNIICLLYTSPSPRDA